MTTPHDKALEDAAMAAFRQAQSVYRDDHDHFPLKSTWQTTDESIRDGWRKIATAALGEGRLNASKLNENDIATVLAPFFEEGYTARDGARAVLRLLLHSRAPIPEAGNGGDGWNHDMDAAPKDKTPVIIAVLHKDNDAYFVGEAYFDPAHYGDGDWWWAGSSHGDYHGGPISEINYHGPSAWRPLPAPPSTPSHEGREKA